MKRIILTKGLPGCGKTTWAKQFIAEQTAKGEIWKRVNKDDLRSMLDFSKWSRENEKFVLEARDLIIDMAMLEGVNLIIDDTNFSPKHESKIRELAKDSPYEVEIKDFTDVPVEECIKRDLARPTSVGEAVIRKMYNQYLKPKAGVIPVDPKLPMCIICDIDGTLAHMKDRGPFEWTKVGQDEPNFTVMGILKNYARLDSYEKEVEPTRIILFSGRDGSCRHETEDWLHKYHIHYDYLYMRTAGDMRKDSIIKRELFDANVKGVYNVLFVLDDRNQVVEMWRDLGLTCLQVAEGDF